MFLGIKAILLAQAIAINQGEVKIISFREDTLFDVSVSGVPRALFDNNPIPVHERDNERYVIIATSIQKRPGNYLLELIYEDGNIYATLVSIVRRRPNLVPMGFTSPDTLTCSIRRVAAREGSERRGALLDVLSRASYETPLYADSFAFPLDPLDPRDLESNFGERRVRERRALRRSSLRSDQLSCRESETELFRNTRVFSTHYGNDLIASMRTPVLAAGRGLVVWSRQDSLFSEGRLVVIDHGGGILSLYLHLDTALAVEGSIVEQGELIGLSGSTGRSTVPHVHFAIRLYNGVYVDPTQFIIEFRRINNRRRAR